MTLAATSRAQLGSYGPAVRCARSAVTRRRMPIWGSPPGAAHETNGGGDKIRPRPSLGGHGGGVARGPPAAHGQWRARAGRARAQPAAPLRVGAILGRGVGRGGRECRARPRAVAARLRTGSAPRRCCGGALRGARRGWGAGGPAEPRLRCAWRALDHQRCGAARRAGWSTRPSLWWRRAALTD